VPTGPVFTEEMSAERVSADVVSAEVVSIEPDSMETTPHDAGPVEVLGRHVTGSGARGARRRVGTQTAVNRPSAWEVDLGVRPVATGIIERPDPPEFGWAADLDADDGWTDEDGPLGSQQPVDRRRRLLFVTAAAVVAAVAVVLSLSGLLTDPDEPVGQTVVLGRRLADPIAVTLPEDALTTVDDSYVGVSVDGGKVLVTVPEQVVEVDGTRAAMPTDPAGWLRSHPDVFVSAAQTVRVGGQDVVQIDYRRSALAQPRNIYARLSLFCSSRSDLSRASIYRAAPAVTSRECTQITSNARVRATFIPVEGRTVLVEAVWRPYGVWGWRMPKALAESYDELLAGLSARPANN